MKCGPAFATTGPNMVQDCPHCFASVIVTSNHICPACTQDVTSPCTHNLAAINVSPSTSFPAICHACGLPADRKTNAVSWSRSEYYVEDANEGLRVFFAIFSLLFLPVFVLFGRRGGMKTEYQAVRLQVPCCRECKSQEVRILETDTHRRTARIAVHKTLASAKKPDRPVAT